MHARHGGCHGLSAALGQRILMPHLLWWLGLLRGTRGVRPLARCIALPLICCCPAAPAAPFPALLLRWRLIQPLQGLSSRLESLCRRGPAGASRAWCLLAPVLALRSLHAAAPPRWDGAACCRALGVAAAALRILLLLCGAARAAGMAGRHGRRRRLGPSEHLHCRVCSSPTRLLQLAPPLSNDCL